MKLNKIITFALLFFVPIFGWADSGIDNNINLTPASNEVSLDFLSNIFGVVGNVVHGHGSQLLGKLFLTFNSIMLCIACFIMFYTIFVSILNTSHEGEFLGKKWSSIWVPVRTVMGVALICPSTTGFSMIQVFVMWIVVQGIGAADLVWNKALDYLQYGGSIYEAPQALSGSGNPDNSFLVSSTGTVFKSLVCEFSVQQALKKAGQDFSPLLNFSVLNVIGMDGQGNSTNKMVDYTIDKGAYIPFPNNLPGNLASVNGICGSLKFQFTPGMNVQATVNNALLTTQGAVSLVNTLAPSAKAAADRLIPGTMITPVVDLTANDYPAGNLVLAAGDYFAFQRQAIRDAANSAQNNLPEKDFLDAARNDGWLLAGSYYFKLVSLNEAVRKGTFSAGNTLTPNYKFPDNFWGNTVLVDQQATNNLTTAINAIDVYIQQERSNSGNDNILNSIFPKANGTGEQTNNVLKVVFSQILDGGTTLENQIQQDMSAGGDPVLVLAKIGLDLVNMTEGVWLGITYELIGFSTLAMVLSVSAMGFSAGAGPIIALLTLVGWITPIIFLWMTTNLATGALLAFVIPLLPALLFVFGTLSWITAVIEAMIAAPLVAVGITHPEGHDFLGQAQQSLLFLMSVFMRPVLMIFGFLFGIILSYAGIFLLNKAFSIAVANLTSDFLFGLVCNCVTLTLYTGAAVIIINRSFGMIYEVPNRVLRWVGVPEGHSGDAQAFEEIKGGAHRGIEQTSGAGKEVLSSSLRGVTDSFGQAREQASKTPTSSLEQER